jgi:hypothetical protein
MPSLWVKCKNCGQEFASGIAVQDEALGHVLMTDVIHACPKCGASGKYSTMDYHSPKLETPDAAKVGTPVPTPSEEASVRTSYSDPQPKTVEPAVPASGKDSAEESNPR